MNHGLSRDLGLVATRRALYGVDLPEVAAAPGEGSASTPQPRGVKESIAALLRGEPPPVAADATGCSSRAELVRLPGAGTLEIEGKRILMIERGVEELVPGCDLIGSLSAGIRRLDGKDPEEVDRGLRVVMGRELEDLAVLDLETTGFWGCPIFLVGLLVVEGGRLVTRQLLACDYSEEAAILQAGMELLGEQKAVVTFNGKSYDLPCLRDRAVHHRLPQRLDALPHIDVLHPARRRWASLFPDCRLQTLERRVLGIHRTGDIPGAEIPSVYHRYAATGDSRLILPVLLHSRIDLLATAGLFGELLNPRTM
jgi:uncharacterized protein YprB with RNaseH-like and TPR domain